MKVTWLVAGVVGVLLAGGVGQAQTTGGTTGTSGSTTAGTVGAGSAGATAAGSGTTPTAKPEDAAFKKTLQSFYDKVVVATKKKDESVMAGFRAKDFTYKDAGNKVYTRDQVEVSERRALTEIKSVDSVNSQVDSVKVEGKKATATVRQSFNGTIADPQNKTHKMTIDLTTRDVWLQNKEGWKLQSVQVNSRQETRDGVPFNPDAIQNANNGRQNNNNTRNAGYYGNNGYRGYRMPNYKPAKAKKNSKGTIIP